jgi:hypothetical protein
MPTSAGPQGFTVLGRDALRGWFLAAFLEHEGHVECARLSQAGVRVWEEGLEPLENLMPVPLHPSTANNVCLGRPMPVSPHQHSQQLLIRQSKHSSGITIAKHSSGTTGRHFRTAHNLQISTMHQHPYTTPVTDGSMEQPSVHVFEGVQCCTKMQRTREAPHGRPPTHLYASLATLCN